MSTGAAGYPGRRAAAWWPVPVAALLAALAHSAALGAGFALDDAVAIVGNDAVAGRAPVTRILSSDYWGRDRVNHRLTETYRPVATLSYALDWRLGGGAPWVFHLTNVLLHAAVCALLAALLVARTRTRLAPFLAVSLLAVHTLATDAVTAIVGRADLLSTLCALALLGLHPRSSRLARLLAPATVLAGVLSKESFVMVLPALALCDLRKLPPERRARAWRWVGYAAALALAFALRARVLGLTVLGRVTAHNSPLADADLPTRLLTSLGTLARACALTLSPTGLLPDYGPSVITPAAGVTLPTLAGALVLAAAVALCVRLWRVDRATPAPALAFAAWFIALALAATSALTVLPRPFAERWWYGALVALAALVASGLDALAPRLGGRFAAALVPPFAVAVVVLSALTVRRAGVWASNETLFRDALATSDRSALAQWAVGRSRLGEGRYDEALARCHRSVELNPGWADAITCEAQSLEGLGRFAEAEASYREIRGAAIGLDGRLAYARFLARTGRVAEARGELDALRREGRWTARGWEKIRALTRWMDGAEGGATGLR